MAAAAAAVAGVSAVAGAGVSTSPGADSSSRSLSMASVSTSAAYEVPVFGETNVGPGASAGASADGRVLEGTGGVSWAAVARANDQTASAMAPRAVRRRVGMGHLGRVDPVRSGWGAPGTGR